MSELNKLLIKYCSHWRSVGYKLGLEDDVLNVIHDDHPTQERECFRVVLQKWLEQDASSATWNTLELAITNARREELSLESLIECKMLFMHSVPFVHSASTKIVAMYVYVCFG